MTRPSPRHVGHGVAIDLADPAAALARARRDHLAEHALANAADLAGAVALRARDRLGGSAGAAAPAVVAALRQAQRHRDLGAEHGLLEREVGDDFHVLAAGRSARAAPPAAERARLAAEEGVEQVAQPAAEPGIRPAAGATDARVAEAVVTGTLIRVGQHLVGPRQLLEVLACLRIVGVGVGVQLAGLLPVRPLDLVGRRRMWHAEDGVEVAGHRQPSSSRRPSRSDTTSTVARAWG